MDNYKLETYGGESIEKVAAQAKEVSNERGGTVEFDFNGVQCLVNSETVVDWLVRDYMNAHTMDWKTVGPKCEWIYDVDTEIELYTRKLASAKQRKLQAEAYQVKADEERRIVEEKTKDVYLLIHNDKIADYNKYVKTNSEDGYSRAIIEYGEQWAKLMQIEIAKGRTDVAEIADECQKPLGYLGITGFQYGCVVKGLSHFWAFGEELRRWHNKQYGIAEDQKGVVNPAILTATA